MPVLGVARASSTIALAAAKRPESDGPPLAEIRDPDDRVVVLLARIWHEKLTRDHPELHGYLEHVLGTVVAPDHVEADPLADRRRYYRRRVAPSRWLLVVVRYEQEPGRIVTALADRRDPKRWKP